VSAVGTTVRLTAGQAIVRWLQAQYSERDGHRQRAIPAAFGIFGHGNALGLGQAFVQEGQGLPLHQPKNEQAMVHTAIGYAKASRRLATLACTASIGPGATNMLTGAATATVNRMPVLLLPADTFASRRQGPVLQQLEHPIEADASVNDAFRPLSRFFDRVSRPEQLLTALPEAMRVLLDPAETGAVTIALHQDVLGEAFEFPERFFEARTWRVSRRPPAADELAAAAELLRQARRPLVIAGGGVRHSEAEDALLRFAEELVLPVAETSAGKGSMPTGHELNLGGLGVNGTAAANALAEDADLVVCVGTRLTDFTTGSHSIFQDAGVEFIGVNVCATDAHKLAATPVVADARLALDALRSAGAGGGGRAGRREQAVDARIGWQETMAEHIAESRAILTQAAVYATLNASIEAGDWVVAAAGYAPGDLLKAWSVVPGSRAHLEFGYSCMGHEIPAGLGIRMRDGGAGEVFVVIGDGTYLMGASELVTSVQDGLKLTVLVLDNGGYQSIHGLATSTMGVSAGNEFRARNGDDSLLGGPRLEVDYAANAESFGCASFRADDVAALASALAAARALDRTAVIVSRTAPDRPLPGNGAFWDLGVPEVARDEQTVELAAQHRRAAAARQRPL
jgi:3D-(3,5/4)-trihydroxycyclohexane-1,2-dione acylhydrolase (decyclizing)